MSYLGGKPTSWDENIVVLGASILPFLILNGIILTLGASIHPAFLFGHTVPGLLPAAISVPYIYHECDEYLDGVLYSYRKKKLSVKERKDDDLLHERFPNVANWEEGDSLDGYYYKENGGKGRFGNKEFVTISGPKSIIIRKNSYHDTGYHEIDTKQIITLTNSTFGHRESRKKDERLKEKAEETTSYEEFLKAKEDALDDIRSVGFDEQEKLPNEVEG